jgi:Tol biopolymer transport system component
MDEYDNRRLYVKSDKEDNGRLYMMDEEDNRRPRLTR